MDELRFAVTTFSRVFDTEPTRDAVTLSQLTEGLQRFILKPKLKRSIEREHQRINSAWESFERGERYAGKRFGWIHQAFKRGGHEAARKEYEHMLFKASGRAKTDLRIWSPVLYPPDSKRGSDNVVHVSCLVLDYDSGVPIEQASEDWEGHYRIVHTTWSHTAAHHKFRLIMPMVGPVRAKDWRKVWLWAHERVHSESDPAGKADAATYALPVVPNEDWPRESFVRPGELLDPLGEGLIDSYADDPPELTPEEPTHFRGGAGDDKFVCGAKSEPPPEEEAWDADDDAFDLF